VIKYLGSKRRLVPVLGEMVARVRARTVLDVFTGTTRVAQEFKRRGARVTTVDTATYSEVLSRCYIETDPRSIDYRELGDSIAELDALPGSPGYFTETFCEKARFFQPRNGARVDAIREAIETDYKDTWLYPILLTSLMEAADRVDSTTGIQMAYLKQWAPRAGKPMELRVPKLIGGTGRALCGDAYDLVQDLDPVDLAYLDPPYNQHRYFTNYHIWETLVRWDAPEAYGIAQKRIDSRSEETKSVFNKKREMPLALSQVVRAVRARIVILSFNNEAWVSIEDLCHMMAAHGHVQVLAFDSKRYVGAQIGIHNPDGAKVGTVSHLRNLEYMVVAGEHDEVRALCRGVEAAPNRKERPASSELRCSTPTEA
jgi:adenine-specific DNA-methyltransferase